MWGLTVGGASSATQGSPRGGACLVGRPGRLLLQGAGCHRDLGGAPDAPVHTGQQGTLTWTPCHSSTGSTTALTFLSEASQIPGPQGMEPLGLLAAHNTCKPRMITDAHKGTHTQLMLSAAELYDQYNLSRFTVTVVLIIVTCEWVQ